MFRDEKTQYGKDVSFPKLTDTFSPIAVIRYGDI